MKRFYCSVCKRIKRARRYPLYIANAHATLPQDRIGECDWHTSRRTVNTVSAAKSVKQRKVS